MSRFLPESFTVNWLGAGAENLKIKSELVEISCRLVKFWALTWGVFVTSSKVCMDKKSNQMKYNFEKFVCRKTPKNSLQSWGPFYFRPSTSCVTVKKIYSSVNHQKYKTIKFDTMWTILLHLVTALPLSSKILRLRRFWDNLEFRKNSGGKKPTRLYCYTAM